MFMLMGGCAGSTGGGVKVMRLVMLFRLAYLEIFRLLHPHSVRHLKIAGKSVPVEVISGVVGFFLLYLIVTTVGTIVLTVQDMDLVSAFTATLTCISNVGPGLGSVGPVDNFSHVPTLSKWVLTCWAVWRFTPSSCCSSPSSGGTSRAVCGAAMQGCIRGLFRS